MKKLFSLILFFGTSVYAQTYMDSLSFFRTGSINDVLITAFEKQLNTYYLNSGINYGGEFGRLFLTLHENYHSTFIRSAEKNIRDEHSFLLNTGYNLDTSLDIRLSLSNIILSDNRKIEINEASVSNAILLAGISPYDNIIISPFGGYSNNRQKLENDYGAVYGFSGMVNRLDFTDLSVSSEFLFRNEDISPRKNFNRLFNLTAINNFSGSVSNNLNFRYTESRKDFYYDADSVTSFLFNIKNNIQSRTESNYLLQNYLLYNNFLEMFSLDVTGRILWRNVDRNTRYKLSQGTNSTFDTDIDELKMEFETGIFYSSEIHRTSLRITLSQRDEKHIVEFNPLAPVNIFEQRSEQEKRKNNTSGRTSIILSSDINLSSRDRLNISFLHNKLRYDTPSDENFDDRDELLSIARINYAHRFNPFFEFFTSLEGTYSHIVYIFSEQSSNNYVNRILRLNSGGIYKGRNFTSSNSFEVSANYSVYDFEDLNPNYRSFSFRQFTASDSTVVKLVKKLHFSFNGYIKLSEQGDFKWKAFSTRPNRFLEELYGEPKLIYIGSGYKISGGLRLFSLKTFLYRDNIKVLDTRYASSGPVAEITVSLNDSLKSRMFAWYEFIKLEDRQTKEQVNMNLEVEWNF